MWAFCEIILNFLMGFWTLGWASQRASCLLKLSDEVLVWLSVLSEVHP